MPYATASREAADALGRSALGPDDVAVHARAEATTMTELAMFDLVNHGREFAPVLAA
jgi:hypothetical protein